MIYTYIYLIGVAVTFFIAFMSKYGHVGIPLHKKLPSILALSAYWPIVVLLGTLIAIGESVNYFVESWEKENGQKENGQKDKVEYK